MLKRIILLLSIMLTLTSCSHTRAGGHINEGGRGSGFIHGDVLRF